MALQVEGLSKTFGTQKAVDNISFGINSGEIVGFLGPNGAGKSTTMKMITGYLVPNAGKALIDGIDVQLNPIEAKRKIGYLPESNALYYDMYVKEYLQFITGVYKIPNAKQKINEVIALTGLTPEVKKKLGQLSKGYKQRVGLAAALVHDPQVLILDEPTSGLDPNQVIDIRNVIKQQGLQKTVLFSSHILQEVEAVCERVIIINKGKLVADDAIKNLKQSKQQAVSVSFKETVDNDLLQNLPTVINVQKKDELTWLLQTNDSNATRKELLALAVEKNLNIVSLQDEGGKLEDIFKTLTGNAT